MLFPDKKYHEVIILLLKCLKNPDIYERTLLGNQVNYITLNICYYLVYKAQLIPHKESLNQSM